MSALIVLVIIVVVCVLVAKAATSSRSPKPKISADWQPPGPDQLPYSTKNYFFSAAERSFYEVLRRLLPTHTIFAKVRLADLLYVNKNTESRQAYLNRISSKHIDFVVCDSNLAPVAAIELDDSSHDEEERQSRDAFLDAAFLAAKFPLIRVPCQRGYQLDEVRQLLAPHLPMQPAVAAKT